MRAVVQDAVLVVDLDTPVPVPDAPWNPKDVEAWSVRWVWFHLIEELARHAGHAEGMPATDWLTPWQPARLQRAE